MEQHTDSASPTASVASTPSSHQSNDHKKQSTPDDLDKFNGENDESLKIFPEYYNQPFYKTIDSPIESKKRSKPKHIKIPTQTSIFSRQSSIESLIATSPQIRIQNLHPDTAKHLGLINAAIEFFEKAATPTLLLLLLCQWGSTRLHAIWIGLPAAAFVTLPALLIACLMFKAQMVKSCKSFMSGCIKIFVITALALTITTTAYTLSLHYLNALNVPWHLLLSGLLAFTLFSFSIAYTQYILISNKATIKSDSDVKESGFQMTHYKVFDLLPRKQKIKSIIMFWSAFVEALSISFLTFTFFSKIGWLTFDTPIEVTLWSVIACIALSRFIKVVNSDAAEAEKIDNDRANRPKLTNNASNQMISGASSQHDYYKHYKVNKYISSRYSDAFFQKIIQLFSYRITPMIENTTNWISLFVLYYDIKQVPDFVHITPLEIKIIFYIYLASTILALSGEYFFQFAADRKWTRVNTSHKYASSDHPLKWRAGPSFYGRVLLSLPSIPVLLYFWAAKICRCDYNAKIGKKIFYRTAIVSKSLGHSTILGVVLLESYYLVSGKYPSLTISLTLLSIALILGILKGYGQCRARKLEGDNLSEIVLDKLIPTTNDSTQRQRHQYQDSDMSQISIAISRSDKIYNELSLSKDEPLTITKCETFVLVLWAASTFIVGLNYFKWIQLPHNVYIGSIILSSTLFILLLLHQLKDMCKCSKAQEGSQQLLYAYPSLDDEDKSEDENKSDQRPKQHYGRETFVHKSSNMDQSFSGSLRYKRSSLHRNIISTDSITEIYNKYQLGIVDFSSNRSPLHNITTMASDENKRDRSPS